MSERYFDIFEKSELRETRVETQDVFDGVLLHVKRDTVSLPNGRLAPRELIRHPGAVCVVPLTDDGEVLIERQYRYPVDEILTEIPAGKLDGKGEDPEAAARRELLEETGARAKELIYMGKFYPTCAYSDEVIHMYLAKGLSFGERKLDEDEFLNVETVPLDTLVSEIMAGRIPDGKTQAAVLRAFIMERGYKYQQTNI